MAHETRTESGIGAQPHLSLHPVDCSEPFQQKLAVAHGPIGQKNLAFEAEIIEALSAGATWQLLSAFTSQELQAADSVKGNIDDTDDTDVCLASRCDYPHS
ncbi:hypothetical protein ABBQ38_014834 [Trebouxia sp. C0009 RCD-2024]